MLFMGTAAITHVYTEGTKRQKHNKEDSQEEPQALYVAFQRHRDEEKTEAYHTG